MIVDMCGGWKWYLLMRSAVQLASHGLKWHPHYLLDIFQNSAEVIVITWGIASLGRPLNASSFTMKVSARNGF